MKIGLLGYGRMGKAIEAIAVERGHTIPYKTSSGIDKAQLKTVDVAIDFSIPDVAYENITTCFELNVPVISGTTGWLSKYDEAVTICKEKKGAFIYASNFSIGVNLFFKLNSQLAQLMEKQEDYTVSMTEIHHIKKLDAPSGTAITLAEGIIPHNTTEAWHLDEENSKDIEASLPIKALRIPDVPGTHTIHYDSEIDSLAITHTAHSRKGFAQGAVIAAEWLNRKTGVFSMQDVLNAII